MKREITSVITKNNKEYYTLSEGSGSNESVYRIDNYAVYVSANRRKEALKFDLKAGENAHWWYNGQKVTLESRKEEITIGNKTISSCLMFTFDNPEWIDDEHAIWLAPGIGLIMEQCYGECFEWQPIKLNQTRINGVVTNY